jgi:hypothetical protein
MSTLTSEPTIDTLAMPLRDLSEAQIRLAFGGGEMTLHRAEPGMLLNGAFDGGVIDRTVERGSVNLESSPIRVFSDWRPLRWDVGITAEIPVDLRLDTGANRSSIDLSALHLRRLELHTGASETRVRMPAAGNTAARIECGFASVIVEVPAGVAARIRSKMAFGGTKVDQARFPRAADGWASPDYETASNRVDIAIQGGFGSVEIR